MKPINFVAIFVTSLISSIIARQIQIERYNAKNQEVSAMVCDLVQLLAEGGSTRDVYDLAYSFIRKHSPDTGAFLEIVYSGKNIGAFNSKSVAEFRRSSCHFEGAADYQMNIYFSKASFFDAQYLMWLARIFLIISVLFFLQRKFFKFLREFWANQVIKDIRLEIGLLPMVHQGNESKTYSVLSRALGRWLTTQLYSIKESIIELKEAIETKQEQIDASSVTIAEFQKASLRAKTFEEKVRMARHDIRGPLSTMKLAVLNKSTTEEVMPDLISVVDKILADLEIDPIISSDPFIGQKSELALIEILTRNAIKANEYIFKSRQNIKFTYIEKSKILSPVMISAPLWTRVLANLVQNAVEAIGERSGGEVGVVIDRQGDLAKISVYDTGGGISPQMIPNLFKKGATFGKTSGNGLGLHFVKACVESWQGSITADSYSSKGSIFSISLPIDEKYKDTFLSPVGISLKDGFIWLDDESLKQRGFWGVNENLIRAFATPLAFIGWWHEKGVRSQEPLLVDLHLDEHISGVDVLRTIGPRPNTYLATSDYLNGDALTASAQLNFRIIPKQMIF